MCKKLFLLFSFPHMLWHCEQHNIFKPQIEIVSRSETQLSASSNRLKWHKSDVRTNPKYSTHAVPRNKAEYMDCSALSRQCQRSFDTCIWINNTKKTKKRKEMCDMEERFQTSSCNVVYTVIKILNHVQVSCFYLLMILRCTFKKLSHRIRWMGLFWLTHIYVQLRVKSVHSRVLLFPKICKSSCAGKQLTIQKHD